MYIYKLNLKLNKLQLLICHKTKPNFPFSYFSCNFYLSLLLFYPLFLPFIFSSLPFSSLALPYFLVLFISYFAFVSSLFIFLFTYFSCQFYLSLLLVLYPLFLPYSLSSFLSLLSLIYRFFFFFFFYLFSITLLLFFFHFLLPSFFANCIHSSLIKLYSFPYLSLFFTVFSFTISHYVCSFIILILILFF